MGRGERRVGKECMRLGSEGKRVSGRECLWKVGVGDYREFRSWRVDVRERKELH